MKRTDLSRRQFAQLAGTAAAVGLPLVAADPITAQNVVQRIQTALGGDWPATGIDGFKAGDPNTTVKGIATTAMATLDVLKRAHTAGANMVITYEPTYFGRQDGPRTPPPPAADATAAPPGRGGRGGGGGGGGVAADDPVYLAKKDFIDKNGMVVYRLHDHWQSRKENEMLTGLADLLGWSKNRVKPDDSIYEIPSISMEDLVAALRKKLNTRGGLRAVGDRKATVKRVFLFPGSMQPTTMWTRYAEVDALIAGEVREWENTFYAYDIATAGEKRGLITVGRVVSEDPGMRACAAWLKTVVKEAPAQWVPAGDLYWRAS